jgi:hypothetical protein
VRCRFALFATIGTSGGSVALSDHLVRLPPLLCSNAADHGNDRAVRDLLNTLPVRTPSTSLASPGAFRLNATVPAGISLPHSAAAQYSVGRHVTRAELQPGDLIFRYSPISHVAMYVGNGMQVAATHTGSTVKLRSVFQGEIVGYSRPTG